MVAGSRLVELPLHSDSRGSLVPFEFDDLPFHPQRVFVITGAPNGATRGGHAHRSARQLLNCASGRVIVTLRTVSGGSSVVLDRQDRGLLIEPGVWSSQRFEADETVLVVLSSEPYRLDSYLAHPAV